MSAQSLISFPVQFEEAGCRPPEVGPEPRLVTTLVTGDRGFVGGHLKRLWSNVVGLNEVDIRHKDSLYSYLNENRFERVVHMAALSHVGRSFEEPEITLEVNLGGTLNLLQALDRLKFDGVLLYVGSGTVYGVVPPAQLPLTEDRPLRPVNPYAVSKMAAEALCFQWSRQSAYRIVMARPFNHTGPGQCEDFFLPAVARQLVRIERGLQSPVLEHGELKVTRDFTHVEDVAAAYQALLEKGRNGEAYNVCSGREVSLERLIQEMVRTCSADVSLKLDEERLRPVEQPRLVASPAKLQAHTGWSPRFTMTDCVRDVITYWRERENV